MRRREFIAGLGSAAAWPVVARGQQGERVRRVGVLLAQNENDPLIQSVVASFRTGLEKLGWVEGRNLRIDLRFGEGDVERNRVYAAELVRLAPDVLFVEGTPALASLQQATRSIPIVFSRVSDPVGAGYVASLARPGGNITGFLVQEPPLAGKWVQLLKTMVPDLRRAAFVFNPDVAPYAGEYFHHSEVAAAPLMVEMMFAPVQDDSGLENVMVTLARYSNGGFILLGDVFTFDHRKQIIALAAQHRLPAIYPWTFAARDGGLISYGIDVADEHRQAARYVDRILRGDRPADLPVQAPIKYELVINLKAARDIGLSVSANMLSIADEVIE